MKLHIFQLDILLAGPVLPGSSQAGNHGVDSPFFRDSQSRLAIPGTHLKGKVREAWNLLRPWDHALVPTIQLEQDWFGAPTANAENETDSGTGTAFDPRRGRTKFPESFSFSSPISNATLATRIRIDDDRGAAQDSMLLVEDRPFFPGQKIALSGPVQFWAKDEQEASGFKAFLQRGLLSILGLGGNQAIGFGRILKVDIQSLAGPQTPQPIFSRAHGNAYPIRLSTTDPICITAHRPVGNIFRSESTIPGSVIKGAIAALLGHLDSSKSKYPLLHQYLSLIRIRHARPAYPNQPATSILPASLVMAGDAWFDAVLSPKAQLVNDPSSGCLVAPAFSIDWKSAGPSSPHFTTIKPDRLRVVRTAIESWARRAKDADLFAYDCILPRSGTMPIEWSTVFDLDAISPDHRPSIVKNLKQLLSDGLIGVTKTKANFSLSDDSAWQPPGSSFDPAKQLAITLAYPALIGDPLQLNSQPLLDYYASAWADLSMNSLKLSHCFATQSLAGGKYLHRRFQSGKKYRPWLLTDKGSVFIFTVNDPERAKSCVEEWLALGLPLTQPIRARYELPQDASTHWQFCPFVPENGFGEIALNLHHNWIDKCLKQN